MSIRNKEPFNWRNKEEFQVKLLEWIGDVLYDVLPEHGYEVTNSYMLTASHVRKEHGVIV